MATQTPPATPKFHPHGRVFALDFCPGSHKGARMKTILTTLAIVLPLVATQAQSLDAAIAAEALRGATLNSAINILGSDAGSADNYRELTLEQGLAVESGRLGLDERIDVQRALAAARRQVLVQALREEVERTVGAPDEKAVKEFFEKNKSAFVSPDAYQLTVYEWADTPKGTIEELTTKLAGAEPEKAVEASGGKVVVPAKSDAWLTEKSMIPAIWSGLAAMKDGESKWFDGEKKGRVRVTRKAFQATKQLTFEEAKDAATRALIMRTRAETWQQYLQGMQQRLGLVSPAAPAEAKPAAAAPAAAKPAAAAPAATAKPK